MDAAAKLGRNPVSKYRFSLSIEMSRLTRDGTAEPVSRDQILRRQRGQGNINFPCSADDACMRRIGNLTQLIHYNMCDHTWELVYGLLLFRVILNNVV